MALIPASLQKGDTILALSPAGPIGMDEFESGRKALENEGFHIVRGQHALRQGNYLAGEDHLRVQDISDAFADQDVNGIICTRGGYGTLRILNQIDYQLIAQNPKCFIGFSDITSLQHAIWQRTELVTFSGLQLARGWGNNSSTFARKCWLELVTGRQSGIPLPIIQHPEFPDMRSAQPGTAEGPLLGGNLYVLASMCGSPFSPRFSGSIVVLEEIDEPHYRIDRAITQLYLAGAFEGVQGVVLGRFIQHTKEGVKHWQELVIGLIKAILPGVPILANIPYGHVDDIWTLPLGAHCKLDASNGELIPFA
ncbi:LD-carboxypeptidase [bacterium]|nr:LD-carboxypeptidase [bacterium]